jgi:hypothetical protein
MTGGKDPIKANLVPASARRNTVRVAAAAAPSPPRGDIIPGLARRATRLHRFGRSRPFMSVSGSFLAELDVEMPTTRRPRERVPGDRGRRSVDLRLLGAPLPSMHGPAADDRW